MSSEPLDWFTTAGLFRETSLKWLRYSTDVRLARLMLCLVTCLCFLSHRLKNLKISHSLQAKWCPSDFEGCYGYCSHSQYSLVKGWHHKPEFSDSPLLWWMGIFLSPNYFFSIQSLQLCLYQTMTKGFIQLYWLLIGHKAFCEKHLKCDWYRSVVDIMPYIIGKPILFCIWSMNIETIGFDLELALTFRL